MESSPRLKWFFDRLIMKLMMLVFNKLTDKDLKSLSAHIKTIVSVIFWRELRSSRPADQSDEAQWLNVIF